MIIMLTLHEQCGRIQRKYRYKERNKKVEYEKEYNHTQKNDVAQIKEKDKINLISKSLREVLAATQVVRRSRLRDATR